MSARTHEVRRDNMSSEDKETQGNHRDALAERAVACKHWRWMPGMLARHVGDDGTWRLADSGDAPLAEWSWWLPDLDDPATLGCIAFALLPEAWGWSIDIDALPDGEGWRIVCPEFAGPEQALVGAVEFEARTLAEALVAALEAAPGEPGEGA